MVNQKIVDEALGEQGTTEVPVYATDNVPKKILVVDDELFQLRKIHVHQVAPDFYETISEPEAPVFINLWDVAKAVPNLGADKWSQDFAANYLGGDEAVATVLLFSGFPQIADRKLQQLLAAFTARAERVERLKQMFRNAFPAPEFDLQFAGPPRPSFGAITQYDAVFLDLFLEQGEASPVAAIQSYLKQLAQEAGTSVLPPIVLMSSHPELEQNKLRFSESANISAAGLMVLPKANLMEPEFGATGLYLSFKQLHRQKSVAHAMRLFVSAWLEALDSAKELTARTLWNLDASAMQQVHLASVGDHDPYDEHLNELLSREHLFHVEADSDVASKVEALDKCFRENLDSDGEIANRLIAPMADIDTARAFMSHFTWLGSRLPESFISDEEEAASRISRTMPFGSVLCCGELQHETKCLIHITQQCDLNSISRSKNASSSVMFTTANLSEIQASDNPITKTTELVARNLRLIQQGKLCEFDLHVNIGDLLALPFSEFLEKAKSTGWRIIGRLRSDITNHILAATTNHMSRPASQKMIRPALLRSKVFLQSAAFSGGKISLIDKSSEKASKPAKVFSLSFNDDMYSFQDEACIEIALWLAHHQTTIGLKLNADELAANLSRGWKSPGTLQGGLKVRVRDYENIEFAYKGILRGDVNGNDAQLTIVFER